MAEAVIRTAGKHMLRVEEERLAASESAVKAGISRSVRCIANRPRGDTAQGHLYQNTGSLGTSIFCPGGAPLALNRVLDRRLLRYDLPSGDCAVLRQGGKKP